MTRFRNAASSALVLVAAWCPCTEGISTNRAPGIAAAASRAAWAGLNRSSGGASNSAFGSDRGERAPRYRREARRRANVVRLVGPGLVEVVVRVEAQRYGSAQTGARTTGALAAQSGRISASAIGVRDQQRGHQSGVGTPAALGYRAESVAGPGRIGHQAGARRLGDQHRPRRGLRHRRHRDDSAHEAADGSPPTAAPACRPSRRRPPRAAGRCRAAPVSSRCCASTMSRMAKRGKRMPGCAALFEGEVDRPLPIGSVATMK